MREPHFFPYWTHKTESKHLSQVLVFIDQSRPVEEMDNAEQIGQDTSNHQQ